MSDDGDGDYGSSQEDEDISVAGSSVIIEGTSAQGEDGIEL